MEFKLNQLVEELTLAVIHIAMANNETQGRHWVKLAAKETANVEGQVDSFDYGRCGSDKEGQTVSQSVSMSG